jgi:hypothetical protein
MLSKRVRDDVSQKRHFEPESKEVTDVLDELVKNGMLERHEGTHRQTLLLLPFEWCVTLFGINSEDFSNSI